MKKYFNFKTLFLLACVFSTTGNGLMAVESKENDDLKNKLSALENYGTQLNQKMSALENYATQLNQNIESVESQVKEKELRIQEMKIKNTQEAMENKKVAGGKILINELFYKVIHPLFKESLSTKRAYFRSDVNRFLSFMENPGKTEKARNFFNAYVKEQQTDKNFAEWYQNVMDHADDIQKKIETMKPNLDTDFILQLYKKFMDNDFLKDLDLDPALNLDQDAVNGYFQEYFKGEVYCINLIDMNQDQNNSIGSPNTEAKFLKEGIAEYIGALTNFKQNFYNKEGKKSIYENLKKLHSDSMYTEHKNTIQPDKLFSILTKHIEKYVENEKIKLLQINQDLEELQKKIAGQSN